MFSFFFFNDTATTEIYTLSLHDALPISLGQLDSRFDHGKNESLYPIAEMSEVPLFGFVQPFVDPGGGVIARQQRPELLLRGVKLGFVVPQRVIGIKRDQIKRSQHQYSKM